MNNIIKQRYNRIARLYNVVDYPMETFFSGWREILLKAAEGRTLEVGIGTGNNIPYYPEHVQLTGIDFSERMIEMAKNKLRNNRNVSCWW